MFFAGCHHLQSLVLAASVSATLLTVGIASSEEAVPVVDLHVDLSYQVNYKNGSVTHASGQLLASRVLDAGVVGLVLPLYVPHEVSPEGPRLADIEASYTRMLGLLQSTNPYAPPGHNREPGRVITWFSLEGASPFAGRTADVEKWVARGVRIWGLVHAHDNSLATSAGMGPRRLHPKMGLTKAGHELVQAIHAAGGFVDVSHASDRTVLDVVEHALADRVPVFATHSNADRLAPHARNLTDDQLRAIASTGGIVGVNFHSKFLARGRRATLDDVVQQIRYMTNLVGIRHVGLGSDYEGGIAPPNGLSDVRGFPALARALRKAAFTREDVELVFSGNVLRLLNGRGLDSASPR